MNQLLITPQENHQWTKALQVRLPHKRIESVYTFPLRTHKGLTSEFTDYLATKLLQGRKRITLPSIASAKCIAVNLFRAAQERVMTGIVYSLNNRYKPIPKRYRRSLFSPRTLASLIREIEDMGLIHIEKGFKSEGYHVGLPSLIMPSEACIQLIRDIEQHEVVDISKPSEPIVLRHSPVEYVDYKDSDEIIEMRHATQTQNEARVSSHWQYKSCNGGTETIHSSDLECRRIFKNEWSVGGRFYCDAQNLPKELRTTITINGERCVELDYKSMHPRMLYHLAAYDAPNDCYEIDGVSRDAIKKLALISTSTTSRDKAVQAVSFHLKVKRSEANELLCAFENKNRPIANMLYKGHWATLQNKDSQIANNVMNSLTHKGIPVLPVHDSFIVPETHKEALKEAMQADYEKLMGKHPSID